MTGVVVSADEGEVLEFPGGSLRLLAELPEALSVHHTVLAAGAPGAGPHHHDLTSELIYVLSGSLRLLLGDRTMIADTGDVVLIPPGVTHAFAASGDGAEFLDVVSPGVERFQMFRNMARGVRDSPSAYDTYTDDNPAWTRDLLTGPRSG